MVSLTPLFTMVLALSMFAGCSRHTTQAPGDDPPALEEPSEEGEPEPEPPPPLDPDSACGRALVCCEAFAAAFATVDPASACAGPYEAAELEDADARCERMILGWREALERHPDVISPPPECGEAAE